MLGEPGGHRFDELALSLRMACSGLLPAVDGRPSPAWLRGQCGGAIGIGHQPQVADRTPRHSGSR